MHNIIIGSRALYWICSRTVRLYCHRSVTHICLPICPFISVVQFWSFYLPSVPVADLIGCTTRRHLLIGKQNMDICLGWAFREPLWWCHRDGLCAGSGGHLHILVIASDFSPLRHLFYLTRWNSLLFRDLRYLDFCAVATCMTCQIGPCIFFSARGFVMCDIWAILNSPVVIA